MREGSPDVRRLGRRRVVTADPDGVAPRIDPTPDDRPDPADRPEAKPGSEREAWLREQVPPHWS